MAERNFFLFPFDIVEKNSKIILYGAGTVGKEYFAQISETSYAKIIKWIDKRIEKGVDIEYESLDFDYVVIAIESEVIATEVRTFLLKKRVAANKIVWKPPLIRYELPENNEKSTPRNDGYSIEKNTQILLALLKKCGIKRIIASPGATNICFVRSAMDDGEFDIYSAPDERTAAYIACGMSQAEKEPVVLSCTGATASRNYIPGLTEAYYRKLPILAVTSSQYFGRVENNFAQMLDRRVIQNDIAVYQTRIPMVYTVEDEWFCGIEINKALIALTKKDCGPVHIDLETDYSTDYSVEKLPEIVKIDYYDNDSEFPYIDCNCKIAICIGSHMKFDEEQTKIIEKFCECYDGVVLCDLIGNYMGKYALNPALLSIVDEKTVILSDIDILIYIGDVTGYSYIALNPKEVWRVNPDGQIRDLFKKTTKIFALEETRFFRKYIELRKNNAARINQIAKWNNEDNRLREKIDDSILPFSNLWIAYNSLQYIRCEDVLHLSILNALRCWNIMSMHNEFSCFSNTGGFGIDGCMSSMIGASIAGKNCIHYLIIGDLAFFYDMNSLGNRHIGNNIRIMLINNGMGAEFRNYGHKGNAFGDDTNLFIAAAGHYGNMSKNLVKNYALDLGFDYISASNKDEFIDVSKHFFDITRKKSVIFEVFTNYRDEAKALEIICKLEI